jgi:hypothetical protein
LALSRTQFTTSLIEGNKKARGDDMSKGGASYQPVAWWFTKRRLGRELRNLYQGAEELPPELLDLVRNLRGNPVSSLEPTGEGQPLDLNRPAR